MLLYGLAGFALVLSLLFAGLSSSLGLHGTALLVARLAFTLVGLAVAGGLAWLASRKKQPAKDATGQPADTASVDDLLREADKRLAASAKSGVKRLRELPLLYLLGESGAAKTTVVVKSGLDAELLAGHVYRERDILPTAVANIWFSGQTALVEAGDAVRRSPALWSHLVARTQPGSLQAARRPAPFRAAVVCVSSEQFMGSQTAETMQAAAGVLNQQLRELARQLGANVPTYVLITKLDRVPGFTEYVRNLTVEEGQALLGGALQATGASAEQALDAITASIDGLLFSLGTSRLDLLARETDPQQLAPAYQFPRELRRFRRLLATYLAELNRSSHLSSNPDVRAFCVTGVRPVILQQVAAAPQPFLAPAPSADDATGVFRVPAAAATPVPQPQAYGEKVAQWAFLPRFFSGVVLQDKAALHATGQTGSGRLVRRLAYGGIAALLLLYLCLLTASYFANAALQSQVETAAATLAQTPATGALTTAQLESLEQLRVSLARLEGYHKDGAPLLYRWGLYRGDRLLGPTRSLYMRHFRDLLLSRTQQEIVTTLSALPATAAPGADYNGTYSALRAYLITTSHPEKSTVDFLSPVLLTHLQKSGAATQPQDSALAQRQFDFYASMLPAGNPFVIAPAASAVTHARTYLAAFGGFERIYQGILSAAEKSATAVRFAALFPNSVGVLDEPHVIAPAFTRQGYGFVEEALAHPDRYFSGEAWVLGEQAPQSIDAGALKSQLSTRYTADYIAQWTAFLKDAEVVHYTSLQDAGKKLDVLSKNDSPLLALLFTVSRNTAVGSAEIAAAFQAPQSVVAPGSVDQYIGPPNKAYVDSLLALTAAVNQGAYAPPDPASVAPIHTAAAAATLAAQQVAQGFRIDARGHLDTATLLLLKQPITGAEEQAHGAGPAQANAGGKAFCGTYNALLGKAPFNAKAVTQASPAEVTALLQPGTGALWQLYNANLKTLLVQQGTEYAAAPSAPIPVSPAFLKFFNRMAQLSQTLFPAGSKDPQFAFTLRSMPSPGVQSSAFKVDAQTLANTEAQKQFTWNGQTAAQAGLSANGLPLSFSGPWAVFELVGKARVQKAAAGYDLSFPLELANTPVRAADGTPVVVRYELSGPGADILAPGALAGTRCVADVSK